MDNISCQHILGKRLKVKMTTTTNDDDDDTKDGKAAGGTGNGR